jgi:hypothetical protein
VVSRRKSEKSSQKPIPAANSPRAKPKKTKPITATVRDPEPVAPGAVQFDASGKVIPFAPRPADELHDEASIRNYHRILHPNWFKPEDRLLIHRVPGDEDEKEPASGWR